MIITACAERAGGMEEEGEVFRPCKKQGRRWITSAAAAHSSPSVLDHRAHGVWGGEKGG